MAAASRPAAKRESRSDVVEGILSKKKKMGSNGVFCVFVKEKGMCRDSKIGLDRYEKMILKDWL